MTTPNDADREAAAIRTGQDKIITELRGRLMRAESIILAFEKALAFEVDGPCPICNSIEGCSDTLGERIHHRLAFIAPYVEALKGAQATFEEITEMLSNHLGISAVHARQSAEKAITKIDNLLAGGGQ